LQKNSPPLQNNRIYLLIMVAMNAKELATPPPLTQMVDEEGQESVPLVEPTKPKSSGLGESPAFWLFMLFLASVTMTVGNKYVMKAWGDFANTLTLLQNGAAVLYLGFSRHMGMLEMKPITGQQWRIFAFNAFFLSMQIMTSLKALPYVAIATVVVFRNACTVVIAIIDYMFFGNKFSKYQVASLAVTTIGMLIYAGQDINFNLMGYLWLTGNSLATVANTFWNKVYITKYTKELKIQTSYGVSLIQQIETLPIVFVMAAANNEGGAYIAYQPLDMAAKLSILATCAGGILIGIAYPKCFSLLSGTSVVVASTANKAVSILIGMYLFGTRLSAVQVLGLTICVGGSLWYALEGKKKR
jgi:drug/metabolite transporter (DMT)-like permease